jgi:hypothetical protein
LPSAAASLYLCGKKLGNIEITGVSSATLFFITWGLNMISNEDRQATQERALLEQINSLKREDETLYNILAVDVWALAKTMDEFQPGFWAAFMKNREKALKRFIAESVKNKPQDDQRPPFLR